MRLQTRIALNPRSRSSIAPADQPIRFQMKVEAPRKPGFRVNPVEALLAVAIALVFSNSVYQLLYRTELPQSGADSSEEVATTKNPADRSPAAKASSNFQNIDIQCEPGQEPEGALSASKIRLVGPLCGAPAPSAKILKTQIINSANKYTATVFTDLNAKKFSTDYIPLVQGQNAVTLEFTYQGGKVFSRQLAFERR